eukprot:CAMPEP_0184503708 /NCGR_PEP_ID=MMETSP0113_2-20130426/52052_1 /TAXON_ID=91329 /ORGANISM="Norrisiella sphaerica, Strain BC52" /LENGTH=201 /DNA_ID=CAMNT_0026893255 /DNA_START=32 /DNA_END=637 /DNA_ORIENTATION=-
MFCTGGIRCERATSYLLNKGFENVYHLKGGILNYLKEIPEKKSTWEGECYVFDERVAVDQNLRVGSYSKCRACRRPLSEEGKKDANYEEGVSCGRCFGEYTEKQKERFRKRHAMIAAAETQGRKHLGSSARPPSEMKRRKKEWQALVVTKPNQGDEEKRADSETETETGRIRSHQKQDQARSQTKRLETAATADDVKGDQV